MDISLRQTYINGTYLIMKNLPKPKVTLLNNNSYVFICQCNAKFLSKGKIPHIIVLCGVNQKCRLATESIITNKVLEKALRINKDVDRDDLLIILTVQ